MLNFMNQGRLAGEIHGIRIPGRPALQLGRVHPDNQTRRQTAHFFHTKDQWNPRTIQSDPLVEPLETREQTQMAYRVNNHFRTELAAGFEKPSNTGRQRSRLVEITDVRIGEPLAENGDHFHKVTPRSNSTFPSYRMLDRKSRLPS